MADAAQFQWDDPLLLNQQLTDEERMVRDAAQAYAQDKLLPRVTEAFRHERTDVEIFREMGELGLLGPTIPEQYGGPGLNYVSYGLIAREVERVDSGYRSMMSVQSSLVMVPIFEFGSDAQKAKYLPKLATGEWIGCFGLTEPNHGSDPGSIVTRAKKVDGGYSLSGSKMWITNSPIADVFVVWAKLEENGKDAIEMLQNAPDIDIVLMDIMMPDMDGYDTMRTIRRLSRFRSLPIIALTAKAMKGDREKCIEAGASDYISKPVDTEQMLAMLRAWLYR